MVSELAEDATVPEICKYAMDLLHETWDVIPHDGDQISPIDNTLYNSRMVYTDSLAKQLDTMEI